MRLTFPTARTTEPAGKDGATRQRRRPRPRRAHALIASFVGVALALSGCTGGGQGSESGNNGEPDPNANTTLRILAGSEVRDMEPILAEAVKATGVSVVFSYAGTLEGAEQVANGTAGQTYDATWFSSNRYLGLLPKGNQAITASTTIMASPVVLGVRTESANRLDWAHESPTWSQIGDAAKSGKFTYGMTNPASSNSGFSALVGVATALTGSGNAIDPAQVKAVTPKLTTFFSGQKLTSGSSGWLADRFVEQTKAGGATQLDGLINYESVLLDLKAKNAVPGGLTVVYPEDGVVSADYPLSLLSTTAPGKRDSYTKLTEWLRTPEAQTKIMQQTHRRPVVPGVKLTPEFGTNLLVELPFPAQRAAADGLITAYLNEASRPSQTIYVIDTSGSMSGDRIEQLKQAFATLSGKDVTKAEGFTRFRGRERVTIIPFNSAPAAAQEYEVPQQNPGAELAKISGSVDALQADGGTAIYDSLLTAYTQAEKDVAARPDTFTSIVLMTDGENTDGIRRPDFITRHGALSEKARAVPTFTVLFGDSNLDEMNELAQATGGRVFDARSTSLDAVFKEIRGYQ